MPRKIIPIYAALCIAVLLSACTPYKELTVSELSKIKSEIVLQKETERFQFYCVEKDIAVIDDILKILDDNYESITSNLQVELEEKTAIYIYPNLDSFHMAMGRANASDSFVGTGIDGAISIVSPKNPGFSHGYFDVIRVALHEFVHIAANEINISAPAFLAEGLAAYMSGQNQGIERSLLPVFMTEEMPAISTLLSLNEGNGLYQYGYVFVEYIVSEYGYEKLIEIYKAPFGLQEAIETVLETDIDDFLANWFEHLRGIYT